MKNRYADDVVFILHSGVSQFACHLIFNIYNRYRCQYNRHNPEADGDFGFVEQLVQFGGIPRCIPSIRLMMRKWSCIGVLLKETLFPPFLACLR